MVLVATNIFSDPNSCVRPENIFSSQLPLFGGAFRPHYRSVYDKLLLAKKKKKKRWHYLGLTCNTGNRVGKR
jgi:hypothetical protein